jgi:RNA polymerase sigma-70 factor (sigma-E family)
VRAVPRRSAATGQHIARGQNGRQMTRGDPGAAGLRDRGEWSADHAVTELYSSQYRALVRLAALLMPDTPAAEQVVQDSFVAMHRSWQRIGDGQQALTYLRRTVVNRSRSMPAPWAAAGQDWPNASPDPPGAGPGAPVPPERPAVIAALRGLPARQREAIVLRYYAGLPEADIATAMGISRAAVKSHITCGMIALCTALEWTGSSADQK